MKSIKVALLAGLIGFVGVAEAKDVYYVSGYFGTAGDGQHMTIVDADGKSVVFPIPATDTLVIRKPECTVAEAWVSDDANQVPRLIRVETDFTFHSGVSTSVFSGVTMEIAEDVTATFSKGKSLYEIQVGTVVFEGDGTVNLSGAASVSDPLTLSAGTKFKLPANYTGGIVITDPENIDPADYSDYVIYVDANGKTQLMPKKDVVAFVGTIPYRTLTDAFNAAKPSGTIKMYVDVMTLAGSAIPTGLKNSSEWTGTMELSVVNTSNFAYDLQNLGNTSSKICFNGYKNYPCAPTNVSNVGRDIKAGSWVIGEDGAELWGPFSNFGFNYVGNLEGSGLLKITNAGDNNLGQNYVRFKGDPSEFAGSIDMTGSGYRLILAPSDAGVAEQWKNIGDEKPMIHVSGVTAQVVDGKTWTAKTIKIDGTIGGSGTLAGNVVFGDKAVIDLADGILTATSIAFGSTLTLKNVKPGDTILKCTTTNISGNYNSVKLCDESGVVQPFWSLKYERQSDGGSVLKLSGGEKKLSGNESWTVDAATAANFPTPLVLDLTDYYGEGGGKPVGETAHTVITFPVGTNASTYLSTIQVVYPTLHAAGELTAEGNKIFFTFGHLDLYWSKWRGTFWEAVFGGDIHGNNGFGRTEAGAEQAILAGDTVIFDKEHYQVDGEFAQQSPYWHYDQNLYIKDEVNPGVNNDWDLKVLEGVTLKMGLRGARATGQNIIKDFKIYVDENSTLELGYWGNTHHYQGVIRPDVTFGGAGAITLGDDMGASCRIEGDLKVKQDPSAQETEVPTLDVRGKELVVEGGQIDVNLTGFGALSGSGTITTPIAFTNATISATTSPGFTFKNETTFTGTLTVDMTAAPTGEELIKICTKGEGGSFSFKEGIDVVVRVGGSVQPAFYTLATDTDGNLCVKVAPVQITYDAEVVLGYDYKTMIVDVDMNPAIAGVVAEVTVADVEGKLQHWSAPVIGMRNQGRAEVMVGDADDNFEPGEYTMTVSVGEWQKKLQFTLAAQNDGNLAMVGGVGYKTMKDAVAAAEAARGTGNGTIKLLTNVFFAPPPGNYMIERGEYDVYITNDMEMTVQESAVTITAPETIDHYVIWTGYPFVIEGNWLGTALPWKTRKQIKSALTDKSAINGLKPFEAYVLGIPAAKMGTAQLIAYGVQTDDPNTIELTDDLPTKSAEETGVVVTKKIIDEKTKAELSATTAYDLKKMDGKSKLFKLDYSFASDHGQG